MDNRIFLPESISLKIRESLSNLEDPRTGNFNFWEFQNLLLQHFSSEILKTIETFKNDPAYPGYLLFEGFPVDYDLPPTPIEGGAPVGKKSYITEWILSILAEIFGNAYYFEEEKNNCIIHEIVPVKGQQFSPSSAGIKLLGWHTEFLNIKNAIPDFIILICLRKDIKGQAKTIIAEARKALEQLPPETVLELLKTELQYSIPFSFRKKTDDFAECLSEPIKLISGPMDYPEINFDANEYKIYDKKTEELVRKFNEVLYDVKEEISLVEGSLLIINNKKVVHGRTDFEFLGNGFDRWVQRIYSKKDLWPMRHMLVKGRQYSVALYSSNNKLDQAA